MAPRIIANNREIGQLIKARRMQLGYTVVEAAAKAGFGPKTWSRYEAGESIRADKYPSLLRVLKWQDFPSKNEEESERNSNPTVDVNHAAWSKYLARAYGDSVATAFAVGYELSLDHVEEDLRELSAMPTGTHIGQLGASWLVEELPSQYLMRYDYEFMHSLRHAFKIISHKAKNNKPIFAHSVLEELAIHLIETEASDYYELFELANPFEEYEESLFELICGDTDLYIWLFSDYFQPDAGHSYHFDNWRKYQFYTDRI